jgi:hypothetical protein
MFQSFSPAKRYFFEYSDGTNGEYDFNDIANLYLVTFTMDAAILESPKIRYESFEEFEWNDKNPDPIYSGWKLDENLTEKYRQMLCNYRFDIDNAINYSYRIYIKTNDTQKGSDFRIYTKPAIEAPAIWSLIAEASLNDENKSLEFYSFDTIYKDIIDNL